MFSLVMQTSKLMATTIFWTDKYLSRIVFVAKKIPLGCTCKQGKHCKNDTFFNLLMRIFEQNLAGNNLLLNPVIAVLIEAPNSKSWEFFLEYL